MLQDNKPLLRRTAKVSQKGTGFVITYLAEEVTVEGVAAGLFGKMFPFLNGQNRIDQIAEQVSEPPERVYSLASKLHHTGVLAFAERATPEEGSSLLSGKDFYELHRRYCSYWLRDVYNHPLWDKITSGMASRAQVLGFAFEKYHYIEGAYEHMAVAAANATPEMMPHLARHFIEEYNHGDIYRKGLRSLFPDDVVLTSQPLPSTRALINFLSESAAKNSFAYYAGNELLQMTENTGDAEESGSIDTFYESMKRHYPYTHKLIDAFIAHTNADQKLGHENVFWEMCNSIPPLTSHEVKEAMNTVRSMAEHLLLFMDGIDRFYQVFPLAPRVPCTLLSE